jgi:methenyltetrahydromethanopterin cyclohydrolase
MEGAVPADTDPPRPSVNRLSAPLVAALLRDAEALRLGLSRAACGATLVDAGIAAAGGIEAGRRIAEICLGGLGQVTLGPAGAGAAWPWAVTVHASQPVIACLGCQYAGWSLAHGEGKAKFFALGSGPGRSLSVKEPLFAELGYRDRHDATALVLEVDKPPPEPLLERIAADCGVAPDRLIIVMTPTRSLAGTVQIAARSLEVALHKAHTLHFALADIVDGIGTAPLPPPGRDFMAALGRTNDAILYGGMVQLFVAGSADAAARLADALPSGASRDYGRPFAETFAAYGGDFYKIDPLLFSPAQIRLTSVGSGRSFEAGRVNLDVLERTFWG